MPNLSSACKTPISSSNHKSVLLHEWWLIKVEQESKLGVGGYTNRETLGSLGRRLLGSASFGKKCNFNTENQKENKVFCSAAIGKRLDNNTLETVDGITITITGCIHRLRTLSYGFPPEVCDHFLSGFPFDWEKYSNESSQEKCERLLPLSFDDLPVTRACDILMSAARESEASAFTSLIIRDILKQCNEDSFNQNVSSVDSDEIIEETHEIDLDEDDLGNFKQNKAAHVSSRVGTLPDSCMEHVDFFSSDSDPKLKKCDTNKLSGKKQLVIGRRDEYPLRSKQMKK